MESLWSWSDCHMVTSLVSYSLWMGVAELSCRLDLIAVEGISIIIRSNSSIIIKKAHPIGF